MIIFIILSLAFFYLVLSNTLFKSDLKEISNFEITDVDLTQPKFSITNSSKKIFVTAKQGNFIDKNKILLLDEVRFKSNDFTIETDNVVFDRKNQTAYGDKKTLFKSKNSSIHSDGFNINDNGNTIIFYGRSKIILK